MPEGSVLGRHTAPSSPMPSTNIPSDTCYSWSRSILEQTDQGTVAWTTLGVAPLLFTKLTFERLWDKRNGLPRGSPGRTPQPQSLRKVHLSNMYERTATDKYLMCSASEERCYFYLKIYTLWWLLGPHIHTP